MQCRRTARIELSIGSMFFLGPDGRHVNRHLLVGADGGSARQYDKIHMFDADVGDGKSYRRSAILPRAMKWYVRTAAA